MKKIYLVMFLIGILGLFLTAAPMSAKEKVESNDSDIPEEDGVYNDPIHPGIKVRVFVHKEKPDQVSNSSLVCVADPGSNSVVGSTGWRLPTSWTYRLNPTSAPSSIGSINMSTIVANSFVDWTTAIANKVTLTQGPNTNLTRSSYDGINLIAWGRTSGSALGVTYTRYFVSTGQVVDVDTIMNNSNKRISWSWSNSNCGDSRSYDAENVMTHELGHWFGMDDEYDSTFFANATMYGYASKGEVKKKTLTTGDILGVGTIYNP